MEFVAGFFSNLLSQIVGATIMAFLLYEVFKRFFSPQLSLQIKQAGRFGTSLRAERLDAEHCKIEFNVAIRNKSQRTLASQNAYWHIIIPYESVKIVKASCPVTKSEDGKRLHSLVDKPVMPNSFLDTGCKILLELTIPKNETERGFFLYWYIASEHGYFPRSVSIDKETGNVEFRSMGKLPIEIPS